MGKNNKVRLSVPNGHQEIVKIHICLRYSIINCYLGNIIL